MFSTESLKRGIVQAERNIEIFEKAIDNERATIREYRGMIEDIERKAHEERLREEREIHVELDVSGD